MGGNEPAGGISRSISPALALLYGFGQESRSVLQTPTLAKPPEFCPRLGAPITTDRIQLGQNGQLGARSRFALALATPMLGHD